MKIKFVFWLACFFASVAQAQAPAPMTQEDAFAAGNSAGDTAAAQAAFNNINAGTGTAKVEGYSNTAVESSYWSVGTPVGPILTAGASKITACSGTPSSDPRIAQQCEAILAIQHQPSIRPPGLITANDPLIITGDAITNDPEAIAGSMTAAYTGCTTTTTSLGKDKTTETCDEYSSLGTTNCSIGAQVTVDADHLFKCIDSQHIVANASCTIGRVIVVDADANYQCSTTSQLHGTQTCTKTNMVVVQRGFDFTMNPAQACSMILSGGQTDMSSAAMTARITAAWNLGRKNVFFAGAYKGVATTPSASVFLWSPDGAMYFVSTVMTVNGATQSYMQGWGDALQMCGVSACTSVTATVYDGQIVGYSCTVGGGSGCPAGFYSTGGTSCRSNSYNTYAANPSCQLVSSAATTITGAQSATVYYFACKTLNDQCTGLAARL